MVSNQAQLFIDSPAEQLDGGGPRGFTVDLGGDLIGLQTEVCPLSIHDHRRDLHSRARAAIADEDQPSALQLLRELAEGSIRAETLAPAVGDALVATARGAKQDAADRAALTRLKIVEAARDQVIDLLERTPFGRADLAAIRDMVAALEASAGYAEEQAAREEVSGADAAPIRRVGSVWLEMKYIRDAASGKAYGPYLYFWTVPFLAV
jgi:hypothetical protein